MQKHKDGKIKNIDFPKLQVLGNHTTNELVCPRCTSTTYKKAGVWRNKQRYKCSNCSRQFGSNPKEIIEYPKNFEFENDIWLAEQIGLKIPPHNKRYGKILNLTNIHPDWLKYYVKRFIKYCASTRAWATITSHYMEAFKDFSELLSNTGFIRGINNINRELIINYIDYLNHKSLSATTRGHRLSALSLFFETGIINGWFELPHHLIRREDYPKRDKALPRYIPEEVIRQLNQHLVALPEPVMRMVLVLQECGLRIGELCQLPFNCLRDNGKGEYRIQFMRWKMYKEESLPISSELAQVIKEQQQ